jgi:hypothetical protein
MARIHARGRYYRASGEGGSTPPTPTPVGPIQQDDFSSGSLSDYTLAANSGISAGSGVLNLTGGAGDFTKTMEFSKSSSPYKMHCVEKWRQRVQFVTPTLGGTTYGFGVGVRSANGFDRFDLCVRLALDTSGFQGQYFIYNLVNSSSNQTVQGSSTVASLTRYVLILERNKNVITATLRNGTDTATISSTTYTYNISSYSGGNTFSHNMGRFCIWNFGGNITIEDWTIEVLANRNIDLVCNVDSNGHGLYATANNLRYCEQAAASVGMSLEIIGGVDAGTAEFSQLVPSIIDLNPRVVYANCFSNPIARGVANFVYQAEYDSAVTALKNAGIKVIHGIPVARGYDFNSILNSFLSSYSGDQIVNLYPRTKDPSTTALNTAYNSGDNIHGNLAMNNACDDDLIVALNAV